MTEVKAIPNFRLYASVSMTRHASIVLWCTLAHRMMYWRRPTPTQSMCFKSHSNQQNESTEAALSSHCMLDVFGTIITSFISVLKFPLPVYDVRTVMLFENVKSCGSLSRASCPRASQNLCGTSRTALAPPLHRRAPRSAQRRVEGDC